jgi:hypothetical protein
MMSKKVLYNTFYLRRGENRVARDGKRVITCIYMTLIILSANGDAKLGDEQEFLKE